MEDKISINNISYCFYLKMTNFRESRTIILDRQQINRHDDGE